MTDTKHQLLQDVLKGLFVCISLGIFIYFLIQLSGFYHDDAYIIVRYAENFLAGNGIVWNVGEKVEGYSSFLWLMLISLLGYLKVDLVFASRILGVAFAFLTVALFFIFSGQRRIIGALLLATNCCFANWALGGLETVAFGFFVFMGCCLFQNNYRDLKHFFVIGFIFSLATMTRPEGMLFFTITLVFCLFKTLRLTNANVKAAPWLAAGFLLSYFPYFLWRLYYYGHLFPCTFYVKGETDLFKLLFGARYIFHFLLLYGFPLVSLLFVKGWKRFFREQAYLLSILLAYFIYILIIGGDHMQGFRFMVPILPMLYLLVQNAFYQSRFINKPVICNTCLLVILVVNFYVSYNSILQGTEETKEAMTHSYKYKMCFKVPDPAAYIGKIVGLYMKENWPHNCTVALNIAGSIPYFSKAACFVDMLGLNDYTIARRKISFDYSFLLNDSIRIKKLFSSQGRSELAAQITRKYLPWQLIPGHGKGDGEYVLSRKPDYIIIGPAQGDITPCFLGDKELLSSPDFKRDYELKQVQIRAADKFNAYFDKTETGILTFTYYEKKKIHNNS
jgi:arabinofuranosyltransferase